MGTNAIGNLAAHLTHPRPYSSNDNWNIRMRDGPWIKQGNHEVQIVVIALIFQGRAVLPALPDSPHGANIVPHPGSRRRPLHTVPAPNVATHLGAQAQTKSTLRLLLQSPGGHSHNRRTTRKGDGNRGSQT